jgi:glycosyltransferase involved in cell wall biosynthesis
MHLIVLENEPSSRRGGQELSLFDLCRGLYQRGHQITLLYRQPGNLLPEYQQFCQSTIAVKQYKFNPRRPHQLLFNFYQATRSIAATAQDGSESLVYSNQYQESLFGASLARYRRIPFVCHLRLPPPKTLGIQARLGLRGADRLITISQQTRKEWTAAGFPAQKIDVVYNGIDVEKFQICPEPAALRQQWHLSEQDRVISYVGRLDKVKGIETLLKAIALLVPTHPRLVLLVAGKPLIQQPQYQDALQQLAQQLNLAQHVRFLGHVDRPAEIYQISNLVVLPSLWAEPFGRTLLEAMACGVPVVASRMGGIPEVLTGFTQALFEPGNTEALAAKLRDGLDWPTEPDLRQRCRQYVLDQFPLERTVQGVEQVLQQTLSSLKKPRF